MIKRTQITIERRSVTVVRLTGNEVSVTCDFCGGQTVAFTTSNVAAMFGLDVAEVCRRVDSGALHLVRHGEITGFVCANSFGDEKPGLKQPQEKRAIDAEFRRLGENK